MRQVFFRRTFRMFFLSFLLSAGLWSGAQSIDSVINRYGDQYGSERIYLHYDKSAYAPGETIWFKAYLMEGLYPAEGSRSLYVDWMDENGAVLSHGVFPILDAAAAGQFEVPATFKGNLLHVRAYTQWMLNFDTAFLYNKDIRLLTQKPSAAPAVKTAPVPVLRFFPEGGDAIAGISNKIAFKANDQWGRPVNVSGVVMDKKGTVIDSFRSVHDGMGYFLLLPQPGTGYTARWRAGKGPEQTTDLPPIQSSGLNLQVMRAGNRQQFVITRTADAPEALQQLHVIGTMHQHMAFKADVALKEKTTAGGAIPTQQLPSGLLTITVFDRSWNALAERLVFINNGEYNFRPELTVQHWGLNKRARNELEIAVPGNIASSLSVSITDAEIYADSSENILSTLLLTGDIKGQVYQPAYYFSANGDTTGRHLDLVMLTHGWRRFKWEDVVQQKAPQIIYPKDTAYLALSGKIYGVQPALLRNSGDIIAIVRGKDSAMQMVVMPIRADGSFAQPDFTFFDTLNVYYQFQKSSAAKSGTVRFMESRLPVPKYGRLNRLSPAFAPSTDTAGISRTYALALERIEQEQFLGAKTLETVVVKGRTKSPIQVMDERYASGLFSGGDGYQFDIANDIAAQSAFNIFSYLQGRVAGLQVGGNGTSLQWRGGTPAVFLNEMNADLQTIASIPVSDIAYVKVFRPPFIGAIGGGGNGAIAIYTKKGGDEKNTPGRGLPSSTITGYTPVKEFYAPNYSTFTARNEQRDLRTTLYWNPHVLTTPQKNTVRLTFYNNDVSKAFRVVVEGMTADGQLTHMELLME